MRLVAATLEDARLKGAATPAAVAAVLEAAFSHVECPCGVLPLLVHFRLVDVRLCNPPANPNMWPQQAEWYVHC